MTEKQAFKCGFIARCIDAGLTSPSQILAAVQKRAGFFNDAKSTVGDALGALSPIAKLTLLGGPPLLGAGVGALAARAADVDDTDVDELKRRELSETYLAEAGRLREAGRARRQGLAAPSGPAARSMI